MIEYVLVYNINIWIFNCLQYIIFGWLGGKLDVDDIICFECKIFFKKWVIIFSLYLDDDVILMGGIFQWFVEQGYEVYVVYQIFGNIVVYDYYVCYFLEFCIELMDVEKGDYKEFDVWVCQMLKQVIIKDINSIVVQEICFVKGLVR